LFRSAFLAWMTGAGVRAGFADCRERVARLFYTHPVRAGAGHAIDRNIAVARALGVDARAGDFRLSLSPQAQASARALLARHNLRPRGFVVVCPGTTWPNKVYPVRHWRKFVAELAQNVPVVLTGDGSPAEHRLCADLAECAGGRGIDLAGQTTIPQFAAVIALAGAVVCSDTAANFIGPAVGTPSVALLGPTRAEYIGPYLGRGVALRADLPCLGCRKRSCRHATCMQAIDPARVVEAVRRLLAAPAGIE
jgi:ADP-heptose:LPS heptosyltransferase